MHRPLEVEICGQRRQVVGVMIHIMAATGLGGAAMAASVVSDDAIAVLEEEQHLRVPIIRRQRPTMTEDNRLSFAPVFEVDFRAVFGGNPVHDGEILTFSAALRIGRWTEAVLLPKKEWLSPTSRRPDCLPRRWSNEFELR